MDVRFWSKVDRRGAGECWPWTAKRNRDGYGQFAVPRPGHRYMRTVLAHRHAWELAHGPIADGLCVLHRCDTPACVNPAHLFLGTQADNVADCAAKGRRAINRTGKLTDCQRAAIVRIYRAGMASQGQLGRLYGVSQPAISQLVRSAR